MKITLTSDRTVGGVLLGAAAVVLTLAACTPAQDQAATGNRTAPAGASSSSLSPSPSTSSTDPICASLAGQLETLNFFPSLISPTDTTGAKTLDTGFHALQANASDDLKPRLDGLDKVMEAAINDPAGYTESAFVEAKNKVEDWGLKYCS